jgi:hypothetical protein
LLLPLLWALLAAAGVRAGIARWRAFLEDAAGDAAGAGGAVAVEAAGDTSRGGGADGEEMARTEFGWRWSGTWGAGLYLRSAHLRGGGWSVVVPELKLEPSLPALLIGRLRPRWVRVRGARLRLDPLRVLLPAAGEVQAAPTAAEEPERRVTSPLPPGIEWARWSFSDLELSLAAASGGAATRRWQGGAGELAPLFAPVDNAPAASGSGLRLAPMLTLELLSLDAAGSLRSAGGTVGESRWVLEREPASSLSTLWFEGESWRGAAIAERWGEQLRLLALEAETPRATLRLEGSGCLPLERGAAPGEPASLTLQGDARLRHDAATLLETLRGLHAAVALPPLDLLMELSLHLEEPRFGVTTAVAGSGDDAAATPLALRWRRRGLRQQVSVRAPSLDLNWESRSSAAGGSGAGESGSLRAVFRGFELPRGGWLTGVCTGTLSGRWRAGEEPHFKGRCRLADGRIRAPLLDRAIQRATPFGTLRGLRFERLGGGFSFALSPDLATLRTLRVELAPLEAPDTHVEGALVLGDSLRGDLQMHFTGSAAALVAAPPGLAPGRLELPDWVEARMSLGGTWERPEVSWDGAAARDSLRVEATREMLQEVQESLEESLGLPPGGLQDPAAKLLYEEGLELYRLWHRTREEQ